MDTLAVLLPVWQTETAAVSCLLNLADITPGTHRKEYAIQN